MKAVRKAIKNFEKTSPQLLPKKPEIANKPGSQNSKHGKITKMSPNISECLTLLFETYGKPLLKDEELPPET